ncbi:DUF4192 domain-containing protein [Demequina sp. NBRC 110053]|uniref:DUF4192 domain-containing protein n=1 Tax=Demequina sp. NBRC 110053 TaxID=1570342 RepID=UPI0013565DFA|nr:DUF4192 domain-containing protein [Demequina sp. NBRC 110053]
MQTRLIHGPGELIAAIPRMLGYVPHEEVILAGVAKTGAIEVLARIDRTDLVLRDLDGEVARAVATEASRSRVARAILVSFTSKPSGGAGCEAATQLAQALTACSIDVDLWVCDGERYWSPGCGDEACCPARGRALPPTSAHSRRANGAPGERLELSGSPAGLEEAAAERRRASGAGDRWWRRREADTPGWRAAALVKVRESARPDATVLDLGRAAVSLRDVRVRDALMVAWLRGGQREIEDTLAGRASEEVARVLDGALHDASHPPPRRAQVQEALEWCGSVARVSRRRDRAGVHALEAVLLWWAGSLDGALSATSRALSCDPDYSLAQLVAQMCEADLRPAWARW